MKTAISIPDPVFEAAERLAKRLGKSRSELYATAIRDYLEEHRHEGVTERLNEIYGAVPEESDVDELLMDLQVRSVGKKDW
ncbi:MAG: CopG family ribbon-helix-helix protein [Geminicoccaceae bacterium]